MFRAVSRSCFAIALSVFAAGVARSEQPSVSAAPAQAGPMIEKSGYVRLEVVLQTTSADKVITFRTACPKQPLFGIDLKQLLSGSDHVTIGVGITAPLMSPLELTPVSIDRKSTGLLGLGKSCDVTVDQIRYLSPAYYVRTYENQQFTVAPTFKEIQGVNPGLVTTVDTALSAALSLSGVPAATAKPFEQQVTSILGQVGITGTESFPKHPVIKVGPPPADTEFEWKTSGLLVPKQGAPLDVILIARLIPVTTLIPDPPAGANGKIVWTPSDVLSSPFAVNISPAGGNTLLDYMSTAIPTELAAYRGATTAAVAGTACNSILLKVQAMGLSDRDQALLMWAITHDLSPAAVDNFDIDNLHCLTAAWNYAPPEIIATRTTAPKPAVAPGLPPTLKQMQASTQIEDAFAVFFKTTLWVQRRAIAATLFGYPTTYTDDAGLIFDSSSSVQNADQWLALHTATTPVASRVGCYTYIPATDPSGKSIMYAIADTVPGRSAPQVLLTASFANVSGNDDAKIDSVVVSSAVTPEQKAKILSAQKGQCSSGYKPPIVFGN